jgi:putative hydrolase of the HAD superfamily
MAIRAVVLDLFDTVVDLHMENMPEFDVDGRKLRGTGAALHGLLSEHSDIDLKRFMRTLGEVDKRYRVPLYDQGREYRTIDRFGHVLSELGIANDELAERLTQTHMQAIVDQAHYLPHHVEVLRDLHAHARIGICSNFSHTPTAMRVLEDSGLLPHIDVVAVSEEVGVRKPRAEIFHATLERLGVAPEEALHVGDRLEADVRGATELGMATVWITRRVRNPGETLESHEGPRPTHVIADLAELRQITGFG